MSTITTAVPDDSPFHAGELHVQTRLGTREAVATFGRQAIRPFMPEQHRSFLKQLPFLIVGSVDNAGWPWASIVTGTPGFIQSASPTTLNITTTTIAGDPLKKALLPGAPLGLLGIEPGTRRRNRVNVHVADVSAGAFSVQVDQSFGNCPQYIQQRTVEFVRQPGEQAQNHRVSSLQTLDQEARDLIAAADTFFVASHALPGTQPAREGVDVSHRGGQAGFVKVDNNTLTIPDYPGNSLFNTLGNFMVNPRAGLIFADFATGDVLQLTGTVEMLWEDDPGINAFKGAERGWRFCLDHAIRISNALPFRSRLEAFSPNSLLTGNWQQATATMRAEAERHIWRSFVVSHIQDESTSIRSFYLQPTDGKGLSDFKAGQFLTLRAVVNTDLPAVVRSYTVSSAPGEPFYRISVKRERNGQMSNHLHQRLKRGDVIDIKAPQGDFFIDPAETRPAVLLAGGVGITPMIAMAQHVINQGILTRHTRELTILHAAQSTQLRAFAEPFRQLEKQSRGSLRYLSFVSRPTAGEHKGHDFHDIGHITTDTLRAILALDDYDFMVCGPATFMQAIHDSLRALGVSDARILTEAFGPASLIRKPDVNSKAAQAGEEADDAIVHFSRSNFEQRWNKGDVTILELAESHGLTPAYGCRTGSCGSCATRLISGNVTYRTTPSAQRATDEVLICCAVPARDTETVALAM